MTVMAVSKNLLLVLLGIYSIRISESRYCSQSYVCYKTCYKDERTTSKCGFLWASRCSHHRTISYVCRSECYRNVCCSGYTGTNCNIPICFGKTTCLHGGRCVAPNTCSCNAGYSKPRCEDINECRLPVTQCPYGCVNEVGSYRCNCANGFDFNRRTKTCEDIDECSRRTDTCQHTCINTIGTYTCSCRNGYSLSIDQHTCEDEDECSIGPSKCEQTCINTPGSYVCSCGTGYVLGSDQISCQDINECTSNNGGCPQSCNNEPGSFSCGCSDGYRQESDANVCNDIDECHEGISGCFQSCNNTIGSFICTCNAGFVIGHDGISCEDVDECKNVVCSNGGTCLNLVNSYSCRCASGYTGYNCGTDINECANLNGGCQDICTNKRGSFQCECEKNRTLASDGKACKGFDNDLSTDVFHRNRIARHLLPRGCHLLLLTRCTDGIDIDIHLSSTSEWYQLKSNAHVTYTLGIVFVQVNTLSLPMSLNGVEVNRRNREFNIQIGHSVFNKADGNVLNGTTQSGCLSMDFTANDMFEFVSSVSFLTDYVDKFIHALPNWLGFSATPFSVLDANDMNTKLVYGHDIDTVVPCSGAPVIKSHLYSVFLVGTEFSIKLFENEITIPKPFKGRQLCIIVDICFSVGGSVFIMLPEESRDILMQFDIFKKLQKSSDIQIRPRGIGLSLVKEIQVPNHASDVTFWNGDTEFSYRELRRSNIWIGGDVLWSKSVFHVSGSVDMYASVPRPDKLLTAMFLDRWDIVAEIRAVPLLKFRLFGKNFTISLGRGLINARVSLGGNQSREICGEVSDPPGLYVSTVIHINPFHDIPVLGDWAVDFANTLYGFLASAPASHVSQSMHIDIMNDILDIQGIINRLVRFITTNTAAFLNLLSRTVQDIMLKFKTVILRLPTIILDILNDLAHFDIGRILDKLKQLWNEIWNGENMFQKISDETEFIIDNMMSKFVSNVQNETNIIKQNLHNVLTKLKNQVIDAMDDYSGFGLKYKASISIFGLTFLGLELEVVYSVDSLMACSRFTKVAKLLEGHSAIRILGRLSRQYRLSKGLNLGHFIKIDYGGGIGIAIAIDGQERIAQLNAHINFLGIKLTGDLMLSNHGLYIYIEANIWDTFLAQIDVSAELGRNWHELTYVLEGRFVAKSRKKRQLQTKSDYFHSSYLDALRGVVRRTADWAKNKLSKGQEALTIAQGGLTKAQDWLESKKTDLRHANRAFDNGMAALDRVKDKLEAAKGPFNRAIQKLNSAQRKVYNICRIRTCHGVCVPGVKFKMCGWFPCLKFTSCMFRLPNILCIGANLVCRGVRFVAFAALEIAKVFVRIPMVALDIAKAAVSVAKFVVDKSRVVLLIAEGVLDVAQIGLEATKGVLEIAKTGLEAVKLIIGAAAKVLDMVIKYGLQMLIDVRNCGFRVELSTVNLYVFDVSCKVNAFKLGWTQIRIRINFKHILQSLWNAATAVIKCLMNKIGSIFTGRKRRELEYMASSNMHMMYRNIRQAQPDNYDDTHVVINETLDVINETLGFKTKPMSDYSNRVEIYEQKCKTFRKSISFLENAFDNLFEIVNETKVNIDTMMMIKNDIHETSISNLQQNMNLSSAGVDIEYLINNYNITREELEDALDDVKDSFHSDPEILEHASMANLTNELYETNINAFQTDHLISSWMLAMQNTTMDYYNTDECVNFHDCLFHAITTLYDIHQAETYPNIDQVQESMTYIEAETLELITENMNISIIYNITTSILSRTLEMKNTVVFCLTPPTITVQPQNTTYTNGSKLRLDCKGEGSPELLYWWYKEDDLISIGGEDSTFILPNASVKDEGCYTCVVGNSVANISSHTVFITCTVTNESISNVTMGTHEMPTLHPGEFATQGINVGLSQTLNRLVDSKYTTNHKHPFQQSFTSSVNEGTFTTTKRTQDDNGGSQIASTKTIPFNQQFSKESAITPTATTQGEYNSGTATFTSKGTSSFKQHISKGALPTSPTNDSTSMAKYHHLLNNSDEKLTTETIMKTNEPNKHGINEENVLQNKSVSALNVSHTKSETTTHSNEYKQPESSQLDDDSSGKFATTQAHATQSKSLIAGVVLVGAFVSIMIGVMVYRLYLLKQMSVKPAKNTSNIFEKKEVSEKVKRTNFQSRQKFSRRS